MPHHVIPPICNYKIPKSIGRAKNLPMGKKIEDAICKLKLAGKSSMEIVEELDVKESWVQTAWTRYRAANPKTPSCKSNQGKARISSTGK